MSFLIIAWLFCVAEVQQSIGNRAEFLNVHLDPNKVTGPLHHFWESTGFCPPDPHEDFDEFFFTNDVIQNVAYIGSVPQQGIKQVRIHWLLDLVTVELKRGFSDQFAICYNFTFLDHALKILVDNGLRPGFELMGNPSNIFSDFDDVKQIHAWRDLIATLGKHLIETFGLHEVSQWNFESWNEPQNKQHFDGLLVTTKGYLMYYDACSEGLKMAHPSLRLGGPATGYPGTHPIFWSLLQHCNNGTNFFTGEKGVRLDFVSFHIKGQGHSFTILHNEIMTLKEMVQEFPRFATVPVYNDEGDPLVGWSKGEDWRADVAYAAIVVKVLAQHQEFYFQGNLSIRYSLLSNDNGFISYPPYYFRQRTLLARFQMNHSLPRKVEFIKKPVLSVMGLLALLGDQYIDGRLDNNSDINRDFGMIPSVRRQYPSNVSDWELAVIFYNSNDTSNRTSSSVVNISVANLPQRQDGVFVVYRLDDEHGNPFAVWKKMGSPVFPTDEEFKDLRLHQEPVRDLGPKVIPPTGALNLLLTLPLPGVCLLHVCAKPLSPPPQVQGIGLISVSPNEVLVTWEDTQSRCLLTFEVLHSFKGPQGPFVRINQVDIIFTSFHHHLSPEDRRYPLGWYVIVAVDYWNRRSPASFPKKSKTLGVVP